MGADPSEVRERVDTRKQPTIVITTAVLPGSSWLVLIRGTIINTRYQVRTEYCKNNKYLGVINSVYRRSYLVLNMVPRNININKIKTNSSQL